MATFTIISGTSMSILDNTTSQQTMTLFGTQGVITDVQVKLFGLTHEFSDDLDMLLQGPGTGHNLMFWSDAGGGNENALLNSNLTFADSGPAQMGDAADPVSGTTYRPTNFDTGIGNNTEDPATFGNPAGGIRSPGPDGADTFASAFGGADPNGAWTLFVRDDAGSDQGTLAQWGFVVTTDTDDVVINGTSGADDILISYTTSNSGTYFLNGTGVAFSGVTSITVNGLGGNDTLTINQNGTIAGPVTFDGGGGAGDRLEIHDSGQSDGTFNLTGPGAGNMQGSESGPLNFTNAETIVYDSSLNNLTVNLPTDIGQVFLEDDGTIGNNMSQVRSGNSSFPTLVFLHPNTALTLDADAPFGGTTVDIDLADALTGNFTLGSFNSLPMPQLVRVQNIEASGTVSIAAYAGIQELGSDGDADITAYAVALQALNGAAGGTGTGGALETMVDRIEASGKDGIALHNLKGVLIGGVTADLTGFYIPDSGDIDFKAAGDITLEDTTDGFTVTGGVVGNVRIEAIGYGSTILASGVTPAVENEGGDITLIAGEDIDLGGETGDSDVRANGSITLQAGRDVYLRNDADLLADNYGNLTGGDISVTAGRNIDFTATSDLAAQAGSITVAAGPGGTLNANWTDAGITTNTGAITLIADRMTLATGTTYTAFQQVNSDNPLTVKTATPGRAIRLGSPTDTAAALELSETELNTLGADHLVIGDSSSGSITVIANVNLTNSPGLALRTGGHIAVNAALSAPGALDLFAGGNIAVGAAGSLAGSTITARVDTPNADAGLGGSFTHTPAITPALTLAGNGDNDSLVGGDGGDTINGGAGEDSMTGGAGDDTYIVDNRRDRVVETATGGTDTVEASVNHTLAANVENLLQTGSAVIGLGNALNNRMTGNGLGNQLKGDVGNDTLIGGGGEDELRGGTGDDSMNGGIGNDRYFVDSAGDVVNEGSPTGGTDTVFSTMDYTLGANLEVLRLQGAGNLNGTGNGNVNNISGTTGANLLQGLGGNDVLVGNDGADTLVGGEGNDTMSGGSQADVFRFAMANSGADRITDFNKNADRFDLGGGSFSAVTPAGADVILTHTGGTIRIVNAPTLTLTQWNALVVNSGLGGGSAATAFSFDHWDGNAALLAKLEHEILHLPNGDWVFA